MGLSLKIINGTHSRKHRGRTNHEPHVYTAVLGSIWAYQTRSPDIHHDKSSFLIVVDSRGGMQPVQTGPLKRMHYSFSVVKGMEGITAHFVSTQVSENRRRHKSAEVE